MPENTPAPAAPEPVAPATPAAPAAAPEVTPQTPAPTDAGAPANPESGTGQTQIRNAPEGGDTINYQAKFGESTKENQRLMGILQQRGIDPKTGEPLAAPATPAPAAPTAPNPTAPLTHEQAVQQIPGFSTLSDAEKAIVMNPRQAYQDIETVKRQVAEMYDAQETTKQINDLTAKDEWKDLDTAAFKEFIYKEENLGVKNLETLATMFKIEQDKAAAAAQTPPPPEGGEPTTAGAKEIAPGTGNTEVTAADAANLRKTDPKRYAALIRAGKLKIVNE